MAWTSLGQILKNVTTPQRSVVVEQGYVPGRQFNIQLTNFSGVVIPQISRDGGISWVDAPYLSGSTLETAPLTYSNITGNFAYTVWAANLLFSLAVTVVTGGSISANYWSGDAADLVPVPANE